MLREGEDELIIIIIIMIRQVLQIGDPRLKAKNKYVENIDSPVTKQLINDLQETMRDKGLVGMAAAQIGENWQVFVTEIRATKYKQVDKEDLFRVYINPEIIYFSPKQNVIYEGCGSVVNGQLFGPVKRPSEIKIQATDEKGKLFELHCNGLLARVIQHEYDHLSGIEFTEKIQDLRKLMHIDFYRENIRNSPEQMKASKITLLEYREL